MTSTRKPPRVHRRTVLGTALAGMFAGMLGRARKRRAEASGNNQPDQANQPGSPAAQSRPVIWIGHR